MASEAPALFSGDWYRQILETAPDPMLVVGRNGKIVFANTQAEKTFGYAVTELVGRPLDVLIPARFHGAHVGHLQRYFARPGTRPMGSGLELFGRRADGTELAIEVSLSPVGSGDDVMVSASIRDISDRKRMEIELREARTLAEAGSSAKSEFLSSMSHELRTPLNAVLGFAQLLRRDKKEPLSERHLERVAHILKGGEHLLRLIDDVLDLSRIEAGAVSISLEPVAVVDVVDEVARAIEPLAARRDVRVGVERPPGFAPTILADRTRFAQILMNFGSNAVKYNRPAGTVAFQLSTPSPSLVRVTVRDSGLGIPRESQDKLFLPFQRAGQETGPIEGTGIGLTISKRLALLMNAEVGFESEWGVGSAFWIDLPAHAPLASASARSSQTTPALATASAGRLVLYVEDNPANVVFMQDLMGSFEGVRLVTAPSAEAGLEIARSQTPDIVLMDINLPGMSGLEALRVLRASPITASIPVIALTAAASERDRQRGMAAGFHAYLTKPVSVDELVSTLEPLLS